MTTVHGASIILIKILQIKVKQTQKPFSQANISH